MRGTRVRVQEGVVSRNDDVLIREEGEWGDCERLGLGSTLWLMMI
jgi:hypothetical protein